MRQFTWLAAIAWLAAAIAPVSAQAQNPVIIIDTSKGKIECELFADKAPITVKNIMEYVADKHYDGVIFHRVMEDFMIQGGGFDADMREKKTRGQIKNESKNGLSNIRGTLAMARTGAALRSAQFFINVRTTSASTATTAKGLRVFGKVSTAWTWSTPSAGCRAAAWPGMKMSPASRSSSAASARRKRRDLDPGPFGRGQPGPPSK